MKLCIACSAGGHLTEMEQLEEVYSEHEHFFLTFKRADTAELEERERVFFVNDPKRNPLKFVINSIKSLHIFLKEKPDAVITTGAGVVIPFCMIAKVFGKKIIYIESYCRVSQPSGTGKVMYRIADLFVVQWREMVSKYGRKAVYGPLF